MSVSQICSRMVDTVQPDESAQTAAQRMHARKVGTLVAIDGQRRPVGIITDRDLVVRVVAEALDPATTLVGAVMTRDPATVSLDTSVDEALAVMRSAQCRRVPVTDAHGTLAGLLSLDDILSLLTSQFQEIGGLLRAESPLSLA